MQTPAVSVESKTLPCPLDSSIVVLLTDLLERLDAVGDYQGEQGETDLAPETNHSWGLKAELVESRCCAPRFDQ
jgi:hypothetical protein